jgi:hypothetical protein
MDSEEESGPVFATRRCGQRICTAECRASLVRAPPACVVALGHVLYLRRIHKHVGSNRPGELLMQGSFEARLDGPAVRRPPTALASLEAAGSTGLYRLPPGDSVISRWWPRRDRGLALGILLTTAGAAMLIMWWITGRVGAVQRTAVQPPVPAGLPREMVGERGEARADDLGADLLLRGRRPVHRVHRLADHPAAPRMPDRATAGRHHLRPVAAQRPPPRGHWLLRQPAPRSWPPLPMLRRPASP